MTLDRPLNDVSLADGIVEIARYEAILPTAKEFLPWHRPRKQYVRQYQWCEQVGRMLDEVPLTDGTLKYLGLPGVDLLDLRHLHAALCESRNINLRFLGFNRAASPSSSSQTEMNVSLDELHKTPRVDPLSDVIPDDFALLADVSSMAWKRTRQMGPYDVVNLDLCDGFGSHDPVELDNNYYAAVNSLFAIQSRSPRPWVLLLTTRADRQNVNSTVLRSLLAKYIDNLAQCESFHIASRDEFAIETEDQLWSEVETPGGLLPVFLTGICKWLLTLALEYNPPTSVSLRSVIGYRVNKSVEHMDLVSLALRFTPTFAPAVDPQGLARRHSPTPDECALSTSALKRVAKRRDADKLLAEDNELNQKMIDATAALLGLARYDTGAYRRWLADD